MAEEADNNLDPDVFICWEEQLGEIDWHCSFWNAYDDEYLERYRKTLQRLTQARQDVETYANEVDALIESRI
jgi:hypothetical protein